MQAAVRIIPMRKADTRSSLWDPKDTSFTLLGAAALQTIVNEMYSEGWRLISTDVETFRKEVRELTSLLYLFFEKE